MKDMTDEIADLVIEFGGGMSGEHGDGLARSHLNEKLFGPQLYKAFRDVKHAFDPESRMNPGKIVNAPPMTENLRYGGEYQTTRHQHALRLLARRWIRHRHRTVQRRGRLPEEE